VKYILIDLILKTKILLKFFLNPDYLLRILLFDLTFISL
jgi:hypothetical protein